MQKLTNLFSGFISKYKSYNFRLIHLLLLLYVFFIPLWPKLPLVPINYTYIAIRFEDLFIALIVLVFLFDTLKNKTKFWQTPLFLPIVLFWLVVVVSTMVGFYFLNTVKTLELGLLHSLRRVEYMIIFFIVYQAVNLPKQAKLLLKSLVLVLLIVSLYGIGQKYLGWPAIQTMNPHYAKGYLLTLDANARISSTFGGHYDLAAYLIVLMPLSLGMYISTKKRWYLIAFTAALTALILTASRASFVAYLVAVPLLLLYLRKF
jgi:hypothetical protein